MPSRDGKSRAARSQASRARKAARERLAQPRDLRAHPGLCQLGELLRIGNPGQQRSSMARADFEYVCDATLVSMIPASWSTFSSRWIERARSLICALRSRVRSRSRRISGGAHWWLVSAADVGHLDFASLASCGVPDLRVAISAVAPD